MSLLHSLWLSAVLLAVGPAEAVFLDQSFGNGGAVSYGFQPIGGAANNRDVAVVACAGPQGSLVVAGRASSDRRVVVAWLAEDGQLDTRFSVDGKESFDLPATAIGSVVGLCSNDGKLVMAYDVIGLTGEHDLRVLRIDPATGLPDPSFGSGGTLAVDLDSYAAGLGRDEHPAALNQGDNGDILLSGGYRYGASEEHSGGFVLRLTSAGAVAGRFLSHISQPTMQKFTVALPYRDGTVWAIGQRNTGTASALRLNPATLAYMDTPYAALGDATTVYSGRLLEPGVIALAAARGPNFEPRLWTIDPLGLTDYPLTVPQVGGLPQAVALAQIVPLPDGQVLYTGTLVPRPGVVQPERGAFYVQRVQRSNNLAKSEVGPPLVIRMTPSPGCPAGDHVWMRTTLWAGRPTLAGAHDAGCMSENADYLLVRLTLQPPSVFASGFEQGNFR